MNKTLILIDTDYLCHRAKYTTGGLSHRGAATGVIYGVLRDILDLQERFRTTNLVFCWDSRYSNRKDIYPQYKANHIRKPGTPDEEHFEKEFRYQMKCLRKTYLKQMGYRNIFQQKGYEGDDLIAACCQAIGEDEEAIIISADHDLYQCLRFNIRMYHPQTGEIMTIHTFQEKYGIFPNMWIDVKAAGGCISDNVKGIPGIGEKTYLKFMTSNINPKSKAYALITSKKGQAIIKRNLPLVSLPMIGTKGVKLVKNKLSEDGWRKVCKKLGIRSLHSRVFARMRG